MESQRSNCRFSGFLRKSAQKKNRKKREFGALFAQLYFDGGHLEGGSLFGLDFFGRNAYSGLLNRVNELVAHDFGHVHRAGNGFSPCFDGYFPSSLLVDLGYDRQNVGHCSFFANVNRVFTSSQKDSSLVGVFVGLERMMKFLLFICLLFGFFRYREKTWEKKGEKTAFLPERQQTGRTWLK